MEVSDQVGRKMSATEVSFSSFPPVSAEGDWAEAFLAVRLHQHLGMRDSH